MPTTLEPIQVLAGVEPIQDRPTTSTRHYVFTKGIRFVDGFPEKIGGWERLNFDDDDVINGTARSIFSYKLNGLVRYLVGTHTGLYDIFGTVLTNITPVKTATIDISNSLDTYYDTLANDPIATEIGSSTLTITDTAHKFQAGDTVTLSGSTAVNGIPAGEINTDLFVRSVDTNSYTVIVNSTASSTGSGGGAAVVRTSGYITVNETGHGLSNGDRVKIENSTAVGGILAVEINLEFIIRNVDTDTFDVYTLGTATSSVTGGGGGSATYREPIDPGNKDVLFGQGYGLGLYGVGLYGVSKTSTTETAPQIWSHGRFGDLTVSTRGNGTELYQWDGDTQVAPTVVSGAPTEVNYTFVSDNIVVVLGYDLANTTAEENGISWSDQGGLTDWTSGQAGSDVIEGAGRFISHASARGENLLFTENQTYTFRYIGGQFIWQTRLLDAGIGLIAQNARTAADGVIYWMAANNFYMWRGAKIEVIPSNSTNKCTALDYVFNDLNFGQKEKIFCWYNPKFREVWWEYPSADSNEPDRVIRLNIDRYEWVIDELDRTAAEYPSILNETPYLANEDSEIFLHENGVNADNEPLEWNFVTHNIYGGNNTVQISAFITDQSFNGSFNVNLSTKDYPLSPIIDNKDYTISSDTPRIASEQNGRYWQFDVSGNELDQIFQSGQWYHEIKRSTPK